MLGCGHVRGYGVGCSGVGLERGGYGFGGEEGEGRLGVCLMKKKTRVWRRGDRGGRASWEGY